MLDLCCFSFTSSLHVLRVKHYPRANSGTTVSDLYGVIAPDAPIMALLASYLGLKVGLISNNVGYDAVGEQLIGLLSNFNVYTTVTAQTGLVTPVTVVLYDQKEIRTWFSFLPNVIESLLSIDLEMAKLTRLMYVDLYKIINEASLRAIRFASQHDTPLFVNLGGDPLNKQAVRVLRKAKVAIVQTSLDELSKREPDDYIREIQDLIQPDLSIVTLAQKGLVCATASSLIQLPAYIFQTIHSNGAGAAFSAGFAYAYLNGWDLEKSLNFASALGGMYCTVKDGFGKFPAEVILDFIDEQAKLK